MQSSGKTLSPPPCLPCLQKGLLWPPSTTELLRRNHWGSLEGMCLGDRQALCYPSDTGESVCEDDYRKLLPQTSITPEYFRFLYESPDISKVSFPRLSGLLLHLWKCDNWSLSWSSIKHGDLLGLLVQGEKPSYLEPEARGSQGHCLPEQLS